MFRITEDPSSGSFVQCLAKHYKNDSIVSVDMDMFGVMAAYCDPLCVTIRNNKSCFSYYQLQGRVTKLWVPVYVTIKAASHITNFKEELPNCGSLYK